VQTRVKTHKREQQHKQEQTQARAHAIAKRKKDNLQIANLAK
jgi:hypothetical protein